MTMRARPETDAHRLLDYLAGDLPGWPYDAEVDQPFVDELVADFPDLDLVEETKLFRWYHDNRPPVHHRPRLVLRRWIAKARA
jgi:hypothetical protein